MERGQYHCLASGGLPGTSPFSSHFTFSPYIAGTLPAVSLVVNPRGVGFVYILSSCRPFKQSLLKIWQFLPPSQPQLVFTARDYGIYPPGTGTLGCVVWPGAGICLSEGIHPNLYPPHVNVGLLILLPPRFLSHRVSMSLHLSPCLHPCYVSG